MVDVRKNRCGYAMAGTSGFVGGRRWVAPAGNVSTTLETTHLLTVLLLSNRRAIHRNILYHNSGLGRHKKGVTVDKMAAARM